ncbi:heme-binding protein [Marinicaulis aureus]|uniref:Heme-binding protein n=1 Tax=Hyphococcus aureus TaxID=2666033 RepID=A0ABW1KXL4_9PROT
MNGDNICVIRRDVSTKAAHVGVEAAVVHGLKLSAPVAAAVVDRSGRLTAFLRSADAFLRSTDIAIDKASTAAGFRMESGALYAMVKDNDAVLEGLRSLSGVALFGGGVPIIFEDEIIGGIGVSGGSEEQDIDCAKAGIAAIQVLAADEA